MIVIACVHTCTCTCKSCVYLRAILHLLVVLYVTVCIIMFTAFMPFCISCVVQLIHCADARSRIVSCTCMAVYLHVHVVLLCIPIFRLSQLSCPDSSVGKAPAQNAICRGFESYRGQVFLRKLSWVYIFALPSLSFMQLSVEFGVVGGLITPVFPLTLSVNFLFLMFVFRAILTLTWKLSCLC